jgi:hypothetical protein
MNRTLLGIVLLLMTMGGVAHAADRIIVNTDIGHNLDDVVALSLLLKSEEVEVLGVVTSGTQAEDRARMARHLLYMLGHEDIPVAAGRGSDKDDTPVGPIYRFSQDFGRVSPPAEDGVTLILDTLREGRGKVSIVSFGPLTTVADAIKSDPAAAKKIRSVVCSPGDREPWEYFHRDPASFATVVKEIDEVTLLDPKTSGRVTWGDIDLDSLDGLPIGRVLQGIAVFGEPDRSLALADAVTAGYCLDHRLLDEEQETFTPDMAGLPDSPFKPVSVTMLQDLDARGFRSLLDERLKDSRPTIIACLKQVLSLTGDLTPALSSPLSDDMFAVRDLVRDIQDNRRLRTSDRERGLKTIHHFLKNLEILQEHDAGRKMIQRLSLASALLAELRIVLPQEYRDTGRFKGIIGDSAQVTVGLENRGPFEISRGRFRVYDWTLQKSRTESFLKIPSGGRTTRTFSLPVPLEDTYPRFRRAYVVFIWQYESGWAKLPVELWIEAEPPFFLKLAEPVTEDIVSILVTPNMERRQQVLVRIEPLRGDWSIPGNERSIEFDPGAGGELTAIIPILESRGMKPREATFAIPFLPSGELNALKIKGDNGKYQTDMIVVFPRPGDRVVWLRNAGDGEPEFERVDGRWALVTNPEAGRHSLDYCVLGPSATVGEGGIQIEVDYYDEGAAGDTFRLEYDALYPRTGEDRFQTSAEAVKTGEVGWHTHKFVLPRPAFGGRDAGQPDFRINDAGDNREIIARVRLAPAEL